MARPSPKAYLFLNEDNHIDDTEAIRLEKRGDAIQRGLTIVTIVMRIVDFLSSVISLAAAGYTLTEYFVTENTVIEGENLWPPSDDVMLWPTILTLIVAVVTLILTTIVLIAYCNGTAAADRWERRRSTFGNIATCFTIFKMIACAVASSSMYITGQSTAPGPQSLWRIACDASQEAQDLFHRIIDLGNYCTLQAYSIAKIGTGFFTGLIYLFSFCLKRQKKKIRNHFAVMTSDHTTDDAISSKGAKELTHVRVTETKE